MNLFRGNSQDFHALFSRFSRPKLRVFSWVHLMKIPLKRPWKYFEKFTINGPWNSLDYKKCNEKHMKKPWVFLTTHEFDLLWDFHGVQEKAMKHIQIFHGAQIHGNLMGWKIHGSWLSINGEFLIGHEDSQSVFLAFWQHFLWPMKCILCLVLWHFHGLN